MKSSLYQLNLTDEEGRLKVVNILGLACGTNLVLSGDLHATILMCGWMALYGFCQWNSPENRTSGKEVNDLKLALRAAVADINKLKLKLGFGPRSDFSANA